MPGDGWRHLQRFLRYLKAKYLILIFDSGREEEGSLFLNTVASVLLHISVGNVDRMIADMLLSHDSFLLS